MQVFKFGGASVKNASAIKNVASIIKDYNDDLMVVISAMGKMTNALEELAFAYFKNEDWKTKLQPIKDFHDAIIQELLLHLDANFMKVYETKFEQLTQKLEKDPAPNYDYEYDQIVSFGEIMATTIVSGYLNTIGIANEWLDARKIIRTDNAYREAKVDWELTKALFLSKSGLFYQDKNKKNICIIQGFIGHTETGQTTTLGREGSDFTAGIAAWCLDATSVTIWKDVPGMLNADPKFFNNTELLSKISFREAIELSYYGASVIHPKTIKPLENKSIPLYVKSFLNPQETGTVIQKDVQYDALIPSYIFKENQILISISPRDFSFITEENMKDIFDQFSQCGIKVNVMQNSAISFSVCVDHQEEKVAKFIQRLENEYVIKYNTDLSLMTVRHYTEEVIEQLSKDKEILLEQRSRHTSRFVMR